MNGILRIGRGDTVANVIIKGITISNPLSPTSTNAMLSKGTSPSPIL